MKIIIAFLFIFFLCLPITGSCQDTTGSYLMRRVISVTEYEKIDTGKWEKTSFETHNPAGLPIESIQLGSDGKESQKKVAVYSASGVPLSYITYKYGKISDSSESEVDAAGKISVMHEFVYGSRDGEKIPVSKTYFEYYPNGKLQKKTKLRGYKSDTNSINYFDTSGKATRTIWHISGLRTTLIEYIWNSDRTEMKELDHQEDGSIYNTIVHKYKDNLEIAKIDSLTMGIPFYWKYDNKNRLIETNANVFFTLFLEYDNSGYPIHKTLKNIIYDSGKAPEKIEYKYVYEFKE